MTVPYIPEHTVEHKEEYRGFQIVISHRMYAWPGYDLMEETPQGVFHRGASWAHRNATVDYILYRARLKVDQNILWRQKILQGEIWCIEIERKRWKERRGKYSIGATESP